MSARDVAARATRDEVMRAISGRRRNPGETAFSLLLFLTLVSL